MRRCWAVTKLEQLLFMKLSNLWNSLQRKVFKAPSAKVQKVRFKRVQGPTCAGKRTDNIISVNTITQWQARGSISGNSDTQKTYWVEQKWDCVSWNLQFNTWAHPNARISWHPNYIHYEWATTWALESCAIRTVSSSWGGAAKSDLSLAKLLSWRKRSVKIEAPSISSEGLNIK